MSSSRSAILIYWITQDIPEVYSSAKKFYDMHSPIYEDGKAEALTYDTFRKKIFTHIHFYGSNTERDFRLIKTQYFG